MSAAQPTQSLARRAVLFAAGGIICAGLAAWLNSFSVPFVFDDLPAIVHNPTIRRLGALGDVLFPRLDGGLTVSGRPLVNLSLAVNHALGGERVLGYHAFNLLTHLLAGLVLFGVVRRTMLQPVLAGRFGPVALPLGLAVAGIWLLHPLQTESVTYVVQRAEALMGLCYLLTLYGFIRGTGTSRPGAWFGLAFTACLLGMASKEVMVSAPLMVFLYDRTFVGGTFKEAWRRRWPIHLSLAATWILLAVLVAGTENRGGTAGFSTVVTTWNYALTQCRAVVHYLWLAIWPHPLVFDYGTATVQSLAEVWPQALLLIALVGGTVVALWRRPVWGFLGAWFFAILAPSSSVVPVASQTMAEHRMYLPLAALVVLAVAGLHAWLGRRCLIACAALALGCGLLTVSRNADYRSEVSLWADTVAKWPANARAHNNLGKAVFTLGRTMEAIGHYEEAIRLQPTAPEPHYNLGLALAGLNRRPEAIGRYEAALRLQPDYPDAHNNLGNALLAEGRPAEALAHYEEARRLKPGFAEAHSNLANVLLELGRGPEAIGHGEAAVRLDPGSAEARFNLGNALAQSGQLEPALLHYREAVRLKPDFADACNNLGNVLAALDRLPEAIGQYEQALQLKPDFPDPRRNLAQVLVHLERLREAIGHYEVLVQLQPGDQAARAELVRLRALVRP